MPADRILVVGASGFVGHALACALGERAIPAGRGNPPPGGMFLNLADDPVAALAHLPPGVGYAVILAANADPDSCARDPAGSHAVNVAGTQALIDGLLERGVRPVFTSSEAVFDGRRGDYTEDDETRPRTLYGCQKMEVERYLAAKAPDSSLVLRLARVYGTQPGDGTLFTSWLPALAEGRTIRCARDQRFSPVHIDDAVTAITALIDRATVGTVHVAGPEGLSRLDMLERLTAAFTARHPFTGRIEPCLLADFSTLEPRPHDITMCTDRLRRLSGLRFAGLAQRCAEIVDRWLTLP